ncbi:hypothetical protein D9611_006993 [Ephemerocybe angulata]|uniref:Uncharacterized protein n=1 Tax=Ephemerocybe angulata TaxID=980116 RepID=A0A8H5EVQ3_9AGAR|nr:hypothetical protein D9611_006993 [Tulosesus angulatus]
MLFLKATPAQDPLPAELQERIVALLPLRDLKALCAHPRMIPTIRVHLKQRVIETLDSFRLKGQETLDMMSTSRTVLSGSAALEIVSPGSCEPNNLNFYCPVGSAHHALSAILTTKGFVETPMSLKTLMSERSPFNKFEVNNGVKRLYRLVHLPTKKTIIVAESISASPLAPILFFHSTLLMNYVTGTSAISLYPELTYERKDVHHEPIPTDIQELILNILPLTSLRVLGNLPRMRDVIRRHLKERVVRVLKAFLKDDVDNCLAMMRLTGTVLSGSAALKVVLPDAGPPGDLNFYCPIHKAREAANYFARSAGFARLRLPTTTIAVQRTPFNNLDVNNGVRKIYRFKSVYTGQTITLSESISASPLVPIFFFHTTFLMNCVGGRGVICFYPELTEAYTGKSFLYCSEELHLYRAPHQV